MAHAVWQALVPWETARVDACCGTTAHAHAGIDRSDHVWVVIVLVVALYHVGGV